MRLTLTALILAAVAIPSLATAQDRYQEEWTDMGNVAGAQRAYFSNDDQYFTFILDSLSPEQLVEPAVLEQITEYYYRTLDYDLKRAIVYAYRNNLSHNRVMNVWIDALTDSINGGSSTRPSAASQAVELRRMASMVLAAALAGDTNSPVTAADLGTVETEIEPNASNAYRVCLLLLNRVKFDEDEYVSGAAAIALGRLVASMNETGGDPAEIRFAIATLNRFMGDLPLTRNYLAFATAHALGTIGDTTSLFPLFDARRRGFSETAQRQFFISIRQIVEANGNQLGQFSPLASNN